MELDKGFDDKLFKFYGKLKKI